MRVLCLGLNHETASVALREKISFTEKSLIAALHDVAGLDGVEENVILSTCNRTELYCRVDEGREKAVADEAVSSTRAAETEAKDAFHDAQRKGFPKDEG